MSSQTPAGATSQGTAATGTNSHQPGQAGAGRGQQNRRNNRRNNNNNHNARGNQGGAHGATDKNTFRGNTKSLNGHIFSVYHENPDKRQFSKTIEALELHVYSSAVFKYADDLEPLFQTHTMPILDKPSQPDDYDANSAVDVQILKQEVNDYMERRKALRVNLRALWKIIWGQCTPALQAELSALPVFKENEYPPNNDNANCAWLLTQIKNIRTRFASQTYAFMAAIDAYHSLFNFRQNDLSVTEYYEQFEELTDTIQDCGGDLGSDALFRKTLFDNYPKEVTLSTAPDALKSISPDPDAVSSGTATTPSKKKLPPPTIDPSQVQAKERALAALFLKNASNRYNGLRSDLRNQFSRGTDQYPSTVTHAYQMLVNYEPPRTHKPPNKDPKDRTSPAGDTEKPPSQSPSGGPPPPSTDGVPTSSHEFMQFPVNDYGGHFSFAQLSGAPHMQVSLLSPASLPKTWIILDTGASSNIFNNASFLSNIRPSAHSHTIQTNGGPHTATQVGDVRNFGPVWYSPHSIANVLSFYQVQKRFRITIDTHSDDPVFHVHRTDGSIMRFFPLGPGLYAHDTADPAHNSTTLRDHAFTQTPLQTVQTRAAKYTAQERQRADQARTLYHALHCPAKRDFFSALQNNSIRDCPLVLDDAKRYFDIYGSPDAALKGRTVKGKSKRVPDIVPKPVPPSILKMVPKLTLCIDIFYVHGILFF